MNYEPMPDDWERALAVVAHPDDLEYGGAAAIAHWTAQGHTVSYLLATRGEAGIDSLPPAECGPLREAEQRAAATEVGVDVVEFLDHPDGLISYGVPLRRDIAAGIRRHRPELVITGNFPTRGRVVSGATWPTTSPSGGPPSTPCATPRTGGFTRRSVSRGAACDGWPSRRRR